MPDGDAMRISTTRTTRPTKPNKAMSKLAVTTGIDGLGLHNIRRTVATRLNEHGTCPPIGPGTDGGREVLCEILKCLSAKGVIDERLIRRLEGLGIDVRHWWRCLSELCHSADKRHPDDTIR